MTNSNPELRIKAGTEVPGYDPELGTRLKWVIDRIGSQKRAGAIAEVKPEMIGKYVAGKAKPSFYAVKALAAAASVSIDWLATGEGAPDLVAQQQPGDAPLLDNQIDRRLMARCADAFGRVYRGLGITMADGVLGDLAAEAYNDVVAIADTEDERIVALKALAERHRRTLIEERSANADGKRSAS